MHELLLGVLQACEHELRTVEDDLGPEVNALLLRAADCVSEASLAVNEATALAVRNELD